MKTPKFLLIVFIIILHCSKSPVNSFESLVGKVAYYNYDSKNIFIEYLNGDGLNNFEILPEVESHKIFNMKWSNDGNMLAVYSEYVVESYKWYSNLDIFSEKKLLENFKIYCGNPAVYLTWNRPNTGIYIGSIYTVEYIDINTGDRTVIFHEDEIKNNYPDIHFYRNEYQYIEDEESVFFVAYDKIIEKYRFYRYNIDTKKLDVPFELEINDTFIVVSPINDYIIWEYWEISAGHFERAFTGIKIFNLSSRNIITYLTDDKYLYWLEAPKATNYPYLLAAHFNNIHSTENNTIWILSANKKEILLKYETLHPKSGIGPGHPLYDVYIYGYNTVLK